MKHFTQYLIEIGYEPWRFSGIYPSQNSDCKNQNNFILQNKDKYKVFFTKGDEKDGSFYFKSTQPYYDFSSMRVGGLATYWIKEEDFNNPIIWGLRECNKPPTLIRPRPNIMYKKELDNKLPYLSEISDDAMNICLQKEKCEDIYEAMFNKEIMFKYETKQ